MVLSLGSTAPEVALRDDQGGSWRLSEQRGRPVVLIFHRHLG